MDRARRARIAIASLAMGAQLYLRLASSDAAARIAPAVNALVRGRLPADATSLAEEALDALGPRPADEYLVLESWRRALAELASAPSAERVKDQRLQMAGALIEALVFVDTLLPWQRTIGDEVVAPTSITLADGRDGQLFAELTARLPRFDAHANQGGVPLFDTRNLDDEVLAVRGRRWPFVLASGIMATCRWQKRFFSKPSRYRLTSAPPLSPS